MTERTKRVFTIAIEAVQAGELSIVTDDPDATAVRIHVNLNQTPEILDGHPALQWEPRRTLRVVSVKEEHGPRHPTFLTPYDGADWYGLDDGDILRDEED